MKSPIAGLFFLSLFFLLSQCENGPESGDPDPLPGDPINIQNTNFLNALIEYGIDLNGDGLISYSEAKSVVFLDVSERDISDLTGIEAFHNLDTLLCKWNELSSMDVSNIPGLLFLDCSGNSLKTLDLRKNTSLKKLFVSVNQLTHLDITHCSYLEVLDAGSIDLMDSNKLVTLDVSKNTRLTHLKCSKIQLTSLDISNHIELVCLDCSGNQLTSLDVKNNVALERLYCDDCQLSSLDLSSNVNLTMVNCRNNRLTDLDVSHSTALESLTSDYNNLSSLDVSNSPGLINLGVRYNPNLLQVCVWTAPFPPSGVNFYSSGCPNVYCTTECGK